MKRLLILTLLFFVNFKAHANNCPSEYEYTETKVYYPNSKNFLIFNCRKEGRREFWKNLDDKKILEVTVMLIGENEYQFNLYRELTLDGKPIKTIKYDNTGELTREEHFFENGDTKIRITTSPLRYIEYSPENHLLKIKECWKDKKEGEENESIFLKTALGQMTAFEEFHFYSENYSSQFSVSDNENKTIHTLGELRSNITFASMELCHIPDTQKYVAGQLTLKRKTYDFPAPAVIPLSSIKELILNPESDSTIAQSLKEYLQ